MIHESAQQHLLPKDRNLLQLAQRQESPLQGSTASEHNRRTANQFQSQTQTDEIAMAEWKAAGSCFCSQKAICFARKTPEYRILSVPQHRQSCWSLETACCVDCSSSGKCRGLRGVLSTWSRFGRILLETRVLLPQLGHLLLCLPAQPVVTQSRFRFHPGEAW